MRIVAGTAGGIPLVAPKTGEIRPTMDRVRAAIFSTLAERVARARVLDLFAGTGALGLEALSRGAATATLVEKDPRALAAIRRNAEKARLAPLVAESDVFSFLDRQAMPGGYDLVFADPPYAKRPGERDFTPELLRSAALQQTLTADGLFILEHLPGAKLPLAAEWRLVHQKRYGATEVAYLARSEAPPVSA